MLDSIKEQRSFQSYSLDFLISFLRFLLVIELLALAASAPPGPSLFR